MQLPSLKSPSFSETVPALVIIFSASNFELKSFSLGAANFLFLILLHLFFAINYFIPNVFLYTVQKNSLLGIHVVSSPILWHHKYSNIQKKPSLEQVALFLRGMGTHSWEVLYPILCWPH